MERGFGKSRRSTRPESARVGISPAELAARGLACPEDLSIVGHNDMPLVDMVEPPLTTVGIGRGLLL
jgi:hypothetical protein